MGTGRPPGRPPKREVFEAVESFTARMDSLGGIDIIVRLGDTTETGSELLARYPQFFERIRVKFPSLAFEPERVEQATAAPGESRW